MRTLAIWAALISYAITLVTIVAGGAAYPGYDHVSQYISELGATGAPHARLVGWGGFVGAGILLTVYAIAAWLALPRSTTATIGFALMLLFALGLLFGGVYPCDAGCSSESPSPSQMMHDLWGGAGYVTAPLMLVLLGVAARRWPGGGFLFPLGLVAAAVTAVAFVVMVEAGEYRGLAQRVLEVAVAAWVLGSIVPLRRRPGA